MKVKDLLDDIELSLGRIGITEQREILLRHLNTALGEVVAREPWDWAMVYLDPVASLVEGQSSYPLPRNFGTNFVRCADDQGDKFMCRLSTGAFLTYLSPVQFYSRSYDDEGTPVCYTITSLPDGRRQMVVAPAPDDSYTVSGLYVPTDWELGDEDDLPLIPNSAVLRYAVLRRYDDRFTADYTVAFMSLLMDAARNRQSVVAPYLGSKGNDFTLVR